MADDDSESTEGVELESANELFEQVTFPITTQDIKDQHGDVEIGRTNAEPISLEELFDHMGEDTFESEEELQEMIMGQMPRDSEGYARYSDSRGYTEDETEEAEEGDEMTTADLEEGPSTDEDIQGGQVDNFDDVDEDDVDEDESVDDDAGEDTIGG